MTYPTPASDRIADYGLDAICDDIQNGVPYRVIAGKIDVSEGLLRWWIGRDVARSARVNEARALTAGMWDERSEKVIEEAADPFALDKAKLLSHHYRWRASKIAPQLYGDKLAHTGADGGAIQSELTIKGYAVSPKQAETMEQWTSAASPQIAHEEK